MSSTDPNLGLNYGWTLGESGWDTGMDTNLKRLGAVVGLSVKDRDLTTPPASPANGDRYIAKYFCHRGGLPFFSFHPSKSTAELIRSIDLLHIWVAQLRTVDRHGTENIPD